MRDVGMDTFDSLEDMRYLPFAELSLDESELDSVFLIENANDGWFYDVYIEFLAI